MLPNVILDAGSNGSADSAHISGIWGIPLFDANCLDNHNKDDLINEPISLYPPQPFPIYISKQSFCSMWLKSSFSAKMWRITLLNFLRPANLGKITWTPVLELPWVAAAERTILTKDPPS